MNHHWLLGVCILAIASADSDPQPTGKAAKAALQPLHDLIGPWRGTGEPAGSREEKQKGFWSESIRWEWRFKGDDAWLVAAFDKSKHFKSAELRYLPERERFQLTVRKTAGDTETFTGTRQGRRLTLDRDDDPAKEGRRIVINLLHPNRHLYRLDVRPAGRPSFATVFQVGATKEGVAFASGDDAPVCIVTGGRGTMPVTHKGKTYYVCCSGCRDAFNDDPETYVLEYEAKKKAK